MFSVSLYGSEMFCTFKMRKTVGHTTCSTGLPYECFALSLTKDSEEGPKIIKKLYVFKDILLEIPFLFHCMALKCSVSMWGMA